MGILFSLFSAIGFGSSLNLIHLGLKGGRADTTDGLMINLVVSNVVLGVALAISLASKPVSFHLEGILFFIAAGLMAPLFGRGVSFMAIKRIGSTRTSSLAVSESLFAAPLAYFLLNQRIGRLSAVGVVMVALGTVLFINESRRLIAASNDSVDLGTRSRSVVLTGVLLGLGAGLCFSAAGIFRQAGVDSMPSALVGTSVGTFAALMVVSANTARQGRLRTFLRVPVRQAILFGASGITASFGQLTFFLALDHHGTVAVSTAIKNTSPLFTFAVAAIFMRRGEKLSLRLGLLVVFVVLGASLAALGRG